MLQTVPYGLLEMFCIGWTVFGLQKPMLELELEKRLGAQFLRPNQLELIARDLDQLGARLWGDAEPIHPLGGLEGPVRLNRHLDTVIMRAFDQRLVEPARAALLR